MKRISTAAQINYGRYTTRRQKVTTRSSWRLRKARWIASSSSCVMHYTNLEPICLSISHQVGLFSAVLTAFLVDTSKRLKAGPTDQTNALLSQTVVLLAQISQQLGPNGSQTVVSLPQPLQSFKLNSSDLRSTFFGT